MSKIRRDKHKNIVFWSGVQNYKEILTSEGIWHKASMNPRWAYFYEFRM